MKPTIQIFAASAAAAALLLGAGGVQAQPQGQQQPDLPSMLHLRQDQLGAYQAMQAASRPTAEEAARRRSASPQALAAMSVPQRLDTINTMLTVQLQIFHRSADATRAFYSRLTPGQQRTFDQITVPPSGNRGRPQG